MNVYESKFVIGATWDEVQGIIEEIEWDAPNLPHVHSFSEKVIRVYSNMFNVTFYVMSDSEVGARLWHLLLQAEIDNVDVAVDYYAMRHLPLSFAKAGLFGKIVDARELAVEDFKKDLRNLIGV